MAKIRRDDYGGDWWDVVAKVKARDRYKCIACTDPECPKQGVFHDVHHIKPLSRGGTTTMANLGTFCKRCHKKRHKHMGKG